MYLSHNKLVLGAVFVLLFVVQQIIEFVWSAFNFVTPYWLLYTLLIIIYAINTSKEWSTMKLPLLFFIVSSLGAILSFLNGSSIGIIITRVFFSFTGLLGLSYIIHNKIDLKIFIYLFMGLYLYFFLSYFILDSLSQKDLNEDLFGHSSSNAIPMSLNIVWLLYFVISKNYKSPTIIWLYVFAVMNLVFIVIQGSRAGIVVAAINLLVLLISTVKNKFWLFIFVVVSAYFLIVKNIDLLEDLIELDNMRGMSSYEEDVRSISQKAFFSNMTLSNFLFGYSPKNIFGGLDRSFNSFLDFWRGYGFLAFSFLAILLIKRIRYNKRYTVSIVLYSSLAFYSLFEFLWGGTLWDIVIYIVLFYGYKSNCQSCTKQSS